MNVVPEPHLVRRTDTGGGQGGGQPGGAGEPNKVDSATFDLADKQDLGGQIFFRTVRRYFDFVCCYTCYTPTVWQV
jgi:hypothetical protein